MYTFLEAGMLGIGKYSGKHPIINILHTSSNDSMVDRILLVTWRCVQESIRALLVHVD